MEQNDVTINQFVAQMIGELRRIGYSETTIWRCYYPTLSEFRKYYRLTGRSMYSPDVTDEFVTQNKERMEREEISYGAYNGRRFIGKRMNEFYLTGTLRDVSAHLKSPYILTEKDEKLVDLFLAAKSYGTKAEKGASWVVRRYLQYWEEKGYASLAEVSIDEVREYILKTASEIKTSSLHNVLLYLRHFHEFLKENRIPAPDCVELCSYKVYREMPIQSYVTDEELERILSVIDTETEAGKRNRAIILVAATTGLRGIDIIHMKLSDIDWRKGEIRIRQKKTAVTVYAPLLRETGEAVQDYILNSRPGGMGCQEVFLRCSPPKGPIQDTATLTSMFNLYQKKAGIRRQPFDGKGFHGLRRRLAKKLLVAGTPVTTISQILGHTDTDSVRQYLSLNTDELKECALSFDGIPTGRRDDNE